MNQKIKSVSGNCCAPLTFEASWDKLRFALALLRSLLLHTDGIPLWCIYFDWISVFLVCTEHHFVFNKWICYAELALESRLLILFLILRWMHFLFYWKENLEVSFKPFTLILKQVQYDRRFRRWCMTNFQRRDILVMLNSFQHLRHRTRNKISMISIELSFRTWCGILFVVLAFYPCRNLIYFFGLY